MIFIFDQKGNSKATVKSGNLHQGSNLADEIIVLAPIDPSSVVTMSARLPNGLYIYPALAENGKDPIALEKLETDEVLRDPAGIVYSAFRILVPAPMTQYAGILTVQFTFTMANIAKKDENGVTLISKGQTVTTTAVSLNVEPGTPTLAPKYTESNFNDITNYLNAALSAQNNAETSENNAKNSAEAAAKSKGTAFVKSIEAEASAEKAKTSETNAKNSAEAAAKSKDTAFVKSIEAEASAKKAKTSETNAKNSEKHAKNYAEIAEKCANTAEDRTMNLWNGEGENSIRQKTGNDVFYNTQVAYSRNSEAGKAAFAGEIKDSVVDNAEDGSTKILNEGDDSAMLSTDSRNKPEGSHAMISGKRNVNFGKNNTVFGVDNLVYGNTSTVIGCLNTSHANETFLLGTGLIGRASKQIILGAYNEPDASSLLMIGNGKIKTHTDGTNPDGSKKYVLDLLERKTVLKVSRSGTIYTKGKMTVSTAPEELDDVARLRELSTKRDLITDVDPDEEPKVYAAYRGSDGKTVQSSVEYSKKARSDALVQRANNGNINLPNQTMEKPGENQAISKQYADDTYISKGRSGVLHGNLTVGGNLTVSGTTTIIDSNTLRVKDKLIEVALGNTKALTTPAGLVAPRYDGTNSGALVFDHTGTAYVGDVSLNSNGDISVSTSNLQPLATRNLKSVDHNKLVKWNESDKTLVAAAAYSPNATGSYIAQRTLTGQLAAPNQSTYKPSDDQYVSKRYVDSKLGSGSYADTASYWKVTSANELKLFKGTEWTSTPASPGIMNIGKTWVEVSAASIRAYRFGNGGGGTAGLGAKWLDLGGTENTNKNEVGALYGVKKICSTNKDAYLSFEEGSNNSTNIVPSTALMSLGSSDHMFMNVYASKIEASSIIGTATRAAALTSSAGTASEPVYFESGVPKKCTNPVIYAAGTLTVAASGSPSSTHKVIASNKSWNTGLIAIATYVYDNNENKQVSVSEVSRDDSTISGMYNPAFTIAIYNPPVNKKIKVNWMLIKVN